MGLFESPGRTLVRDSSDIYRNKADRLADEARSFYQNGRFAEAEERVRQLIDLQSRVVGERHPEFAGGLAMLAQVLFAQDELSDAETVLQRALEIHKKAKGDRDPEYASSLDLMGRILLRWDDFEAAEPYLEKAMDVRREVLGEEHADYASSVASKAEFLSKRNSLDAAEAAHLEALDLRRRAVGQEHVDYASTLCGLSDVLERKGRIDEAVPMLMQAVEVYRRQGNAANREHVSALSTLAQWFFKLGRMTEAEQHWRLLLDMRRQAVGDKHAECAQIQTQLGQMALRRGDVKEAENLFRQALEARKHALGERHHEYANSLSNLALTLQRSNDYVAAEPLMRQALAIRKDVFGPKHPEYANSLMNLALLVQKRGDPAWARMLLKEAAEVRKVALGENHTDYAQCLSSLADVLSQLNEDAKAEALIREVLEIRFNAHGEEHPSVAASLSTLAGMLRKRGELEEAESLLYHALEIRGKVLGTTHPDYATTLGNLAWLHQKRGDFEGAEQLLSEALEIRRKKLGEDHPDFRQNLERLQSLKASRPEAVVETKPAETPKHVPLSRRPVAPPHHSHETPLDSGLESRVELSVKKLDEIPQVHDEALIHPREIRSGSPSPERDCDSSYDHLHAKESAACLEHEIQETQTSSCMLPSDASVKSVPETSTHPISSEDVPHAALLLFGNTPEEVDSAAAAEDETIVEGLARANITDDLQKPLVLDLVKEAIFDHDDERPEDEDLLSDFASQGAGLESLVDEVPANCSDSQEVDETHGAGTDGLESDTSTKEQTAALIEVQCVGEPNATEIRSEEDVATTSTHEPLFAARLDKMPSAPPTESVPDLAAVDSVPESIEPEIAEELELFPVRLDPEMRDDNAEIESRECLSPDAENTPEPVVAVANTEPHETIQIVPEPEVPPVHMTNNLLTSPRPVPVSEASTPGVIFAEEEVKTSRSHSMSQNSSHLSQELATMSDRFSELGERLLTAARQLHAPGAPPPDDLLASVSACRSEFSSLRQRTLELAESLHLTCPAAEKIGNLQDLNGILDQVAEAEIHQSKSEEQRRRALSVIDRVLSLSHSSIPDFAPLRDCHEKANALRATIVDGHWKNLPEDVTKLAEGEHHFADLMALIEDHHELADDHWANLHESVGQHFGKQLAAAAARSKLVLQPSHEPALASH